MASESPELFLSASQKRGFSAIRLPRLALGRTRSMGKSLDGGDWCDRTPFRKAADDHETPSREAADDSTPAAESMNMHSTFATRHRQVLRDVKYDSCARQIQKNWAATRTRLAKRRLMYSTARRLHMHRASFQQREAFQKRLDRCGIAPPTVWQVNQAPKILREVAQDLRTAIRTVRTGGQVLGGLQAAALDRKVDPKGWKLVKSHVRNLAAMAAVEAILDDTHSAEVQWAELLKSVQTP
mmetsp:Transcript_30887/g.56032  ORF Transcript_30887/g.56032 Transcript_30887/m.56032 type:complete len:240 (-) Transcript_30887:138-857(-)|eukprot:CAMPEP_0197623234 /NCGR_PEP_ID=MMETSP1338-20131121/3291_1 /TAXON_ID=43686 ORGANISM="Pelagodinium beii, Strain RCC1491" /NCGR_SAMPLE_ID=MMETSP1338 /ASSEMBLY_ACC=CAM_ASM_000754 /LENGTH=239 /DNA_ID=CAMNT_0043193145 /DNA_START=42 /DNA_END=764 /DNA_ORIENTATION=-